MNVYDFDGTIYNGDSTVDFFLFALKKKPALIRFIPKQTKGFILYGLKRIKKTEMKEHFFSFLSGVEAEKLLNEFWAHNQRKIYKWYLNQKKADDIIISASPEFLLKPVCSILGIHNLIASKVDIKTGKFSGKNCYGEEKVYRLFAEYQIDHIGEFYSDSYSDLPLSKIANRSFMINNGAVTDWR